MADQAIGVIGAGIVGLAIGREIAQRRPGVRVVVVDKEDRVAAHQTGHNSGVVHAGIYYKPGSLKAVLCAKGRDLLKDYCAERRLPYHECGKLVVAISPDELTRMDALADRAGDNHVPGLRRVGPAEIRDLEPHATGLAALYSPRTAITDFTAVAESFAEDIVAAGGEVRLNFPVTRIVDSPTGIELHGKDDSLRVDQLIVCAGIQSDLVAGLAGDTAAPRIVPFRGEYMKVRDEKADLVRDLVPQIQAALQGARQG